MITYFESTDQQVVAFEMGNGDAIYLVNLGNETVKDIQVDFPDPSRPDSHWSIVFSTDNPAFYLALQSYQKDLKIIECETTEHKWESEWRWTCRYKHCAALTMGAFSFHIARVVHDS